MQRLSKLQHIILLFVISSNVIFIPVLQKWFKIGRWGDYAFVIPNVKLNFFNSIKISTDTLVSYHALSATILLFFLMIQLFLMSFRLIKLSFHKILGRFIIFIITPFFFFLAINASLFVLKTPFNQMMYFILPFLVAFNLMAAYHFARKRNIKQHMDAIYSSFIILCSAPIYRCILTFIVIITNYHVRVITTNELPIDGGAIYTYIVLIAFIAIPAILNKRMKTNIITPLFLIIVLIFSLLFLPWQFYGAPNRARMIDNAYFFQIF